MLGFRIVFTILILLAQIYLYRRFTRSSLSHAPTPHMRRTLGGLFLAFSIPVVVLFFWRPRLAEWPSWTIIAVVYPFYIWHAASVLMCLGFGLLRLGRTLVSLVQRLLKKRRVIAQSTDTHRAVAESRFNPARRVFFRQGFTILAGATVAGTAYSAFRRGDYEITESTISIPGLPASFDGFTIALVSDIHSSPFMTLPQMRTYVDGINSLHADLIAIPGDLVNSEVEEAYPLAEALADLRAPFGVFATLGNHDFFTRDPDQVTSIVAKTGISVLRNEAVRVEKAGSAIALAGIDDTGNPRRANLLMQRVFHRSEGQISRILLCHRPYFFEEAASQKIDLTLSGHTHGGQVVLARIGNSVIAPARVASPYVAGLYSLGANKMYVSRGIGTVGIPFRVNCPPEITRITLRAS